MTYEDSDLPALSLYAGALLPARKHGVVVKLTSEQKAAIARGHAAIALWDEVDLDNGPVPERLKPRKSRG